MKRLSVPLALASLMLATLASPASAGPASPSSSLSNPAGCATLTYAWSNHKKARTAELRIHHFGIFETSRRVAPVGASGSFQMPADVTFVAGDQYTVLGVLLDSGGRTINPSGAVWWGTC